MHIEDGIITRISGGDAEDAIDYTGYTVIPGIFDTHNHGTQGFSLYSGDSQEHYKKQLEGYLFGLASEGVTSVFPTLFGMSQIKQSNITAISQIASIAENPVEGAQIAGIHYEGPYLNRVGEKGTRTAPPDIDLSYVESVIEAGKGHFKLMGLAPELEGSGELIDLLLDKGITAAFAHSDMLSAEAFKAFDAGITVATHLCNVMVGVHHRDVGALGAALLDDRVYCELICDGMHVSNDMLRLVLKSKPHEKIMLISDCTGYSGAPAGKYSGFLGSEGVVIVNSDGFVKEPGGRLRGSSKSVLYGIWNLVHNLGVDMSDAVKMASLYPARKYGKGDKKGSLKAGKDADFAVIDSHCKVIATYAAGIEVYNKKDRDKVFNPEMLKLRMEEC